MSETTSKEALFQQLIASCNALDNALRALNEHERFDVGDTDSYAIAAEVERAIAATEQLLAGDTSETTYEEDPSVQDGYPHSPDLMDRGPMEWVTEAGGE